MMTVTESLALSRSTLPMAYKTNLLVFSAGGYKFSDFLRAGTPLLVIMWVALSLLLAW
ncbi:MAG: hypothetical protein K9N23_12100 [Akkermansiaceae bacterium]|nr:hypothetical protein [Akkermansiaceae bacterium]